MKYGIHQIALELAATAAGSAYFGNALRVAKDLPCCTAEDRALLDRWATAGRANQPDSFALHSLALKIRKSVTVTRQEVRDLARCVVATSIWRREVVSPDLNPETLAEIDAFIARSKKAIKKLRKLLKE